MKEWPSARRPRLREAKTRTGRIGRSGPAYQQDASDVRLVCAEEAFCTGLAYNKHHTGARVDSRDRERCPIKEAPGEVDAHDISRIMHLA